MGQELNVSSTISVFGIEKCHFSSPFTIFTEYNVTFSQSFPAVLVEPIK